MYFILWWIKKNYYTILYYTILYYTILYYTILYYTILYFTLLYFTIQVTQTEYTKLTREYVWVALIGTQP